MPYIAPDVIMQAKQRFLQNNPDTRRIVLRFDNDQTGRLAVQTIRAVLPEIYG